MMYSSSKINREKFTIDFHTAQEKEKVKAKTKVVLRDN